MSGQAGSVQTLQIKKYPNRRYYDATRSLHVTLQDVFNLILEGCDVVVTDSRTGEDITNLVLAQIILEKDHPKLNLFPSTIFHQMIRANRHVLRSYVDRFFGPFLQAFASTQRQFESYMRQAMGGTTMTPFDWANRMMSAFAPPSTASNGAPGAEDAPPESGGLDSGIHMPDESSAIHGAPQQTDPAMLHELQAQIQELQRRMESMSTAQSSARPPQAPTA